MSGSSSSAAAATSVMAHPSPATKYEVFLSFRGVDTRNSFTTYLNDKLGRKKIKTFIDYNIDRGNKISDELYTGIEESMIYVIIFSENYASSAWCLKELVKIWECKERYGRHVIPVFYKVEPATIKYQKGSYEKAFADHINQKWFDQEEIKTWKVALNNAAELKGTSVDDTRPEIKVVDGIVEDIVKKLNRSFSSTDDQGMVGIDKHIAQMESLLQLESLGVRIIGIWGMGGIGKTTLARALHNKLASKFSSSCCVIHAQKEIERAGIDSLRAKILSEFLDNEVIPSNGLHYAIERVKRARVLLILDDLKDSDQLEELVVGRGNFGQGSRIIVTSRDMQVLKNAREDEIYQVTKMSDENSLQLFSLNAFKQNPFVKTYKTLVERVLEYAQGVPLVLNVLGRFLYGKSMEAWESQLKKLQNFPHLEIFNVLKLSYDGLDDEEKKIFLEIVCFYVGQLKYIALDLLDGCGFFAHIGMDVLKDRGLISIVHDRIVMHDLILEMGLQIVSQRCVNNNPGKHVGLCKFEEIYNNQGMGAIHFLTIKEDQVDPETFKNMPSLRILYMYKNTLFAQGQSNVKLPPTFRESLADGVQILCWEGYPLTYLLLGSCRKNLVKLYMRNSHLRQLSEDDLDLPNLKRLDLSFSSKLILLPDLSKFPNIEEIILDCCTSLIQVYSSGFLNELKLLWLNGCIELISLNIRSNILSRSSGLVGLYNCWRLHEFSICGTRAVGEFSGAKEIYDDARHLDVKYSNDLGELRGITPSGFIHELCWLDLSRCTYLTNLPADLCKLKLLRRLYLNRCINLVNFPEIEEPMENLAVLSLAGTSIQELPSSLHRLVGLEELNLYGCYRLKMIPSSIGTLTKLCKLELGDCESLETFPSSIFKLKLTGLDLTGCSKLKTFPEILEPAESFSYISLEETAIKELPSSFDRLVGLEELNLHKCKRLEIIPSWIGTLTKLCKLRLTQCKSLETFPSSIFKLKLKILDLTGCSKLKIFPEILEPAESFTHIGLIGTKIKELPSSLDRLVGLQTLRIIWCNDLESLPNKIGNLNLLSCLYIESCDKLTEIPNDIVRLSSSLTKLSLRNIGIVSLPESIAHLSRLESLDVSRCKKLECIPALPPSMKKLLAFNCPSITRVVPNPSDSKEGTFIFNLTSNGEHNPSAHCNIVEDSRLRIIEGAYRSVYYCFPGSAVPHWFPYHCEGNSLTVDKDSLNWCNDNKFTGFAVCAVLHYPKCGYLRFSLTYESDGRTHELPYGDDDQLSNSLSKTLRKMDGMGFHTFLWKYHLMDSASIDKGTFHALKLTFETTTHTVWSTRYVEYSDESYSDESSSGSDDGWKIDYFNVARCGICPLYTKEKK